MKILILCTGNSCRSQMAEGLFKSFDNKLDVYSAGTNPAQIVSPNAVIVMKEIGIDISKNKPKNVYQFLNQNFDYVITVCDNANETCPFFSGTTKRKLHYGYEDPGDTIGTEEDILNAHREVRDRMKKDFYKLYKQLMSI
jgi:arsenate reductase (thioredoxin)